ncbi:antA/AntB antirepressor family protein [Bartonella raoultii]|uniref:AntA/AntB antirepressor family protein n=1 Tax=Bartonella raoultii TaxID=1457020 RepID=A0ABS7IA99_9HYPH|nr:antA/AntB antirepressor family protein [Bartonella raoultii]MBX4336039.1 antA/AntB antirepressor family protein [Bartonella raoultii]MBX4336552.1 antA/AntB antirepressor family protein [Bartonella raoultii]
MTKHNDNEENEQYLISKDEVKDRTGYVQMVNAHALHEHLQLQQDFDTWFNNHVEKLGLKEGMHFVFTKQEGKRSKICSKSEIDPNATNSHHFKIYAAKDILEAEPHRNQVVILKQILSPYW